MTRKNIKNPLTIDKAKLEMVHIRTMNHLGHHITWQEFARMSDVSLNTLSNIRNNRTVGSANTLTKIVKAVNETGLNISEEELLNQKP
jgi:transcriptional regulator with XRE-family HTH domain